MKNRYFDTTEIDKVDPSIPSYLKDKAGIRVAKYIKVHYEKVETVKQLTGRLPAPGEMYKLWTINSFTAFTFLPFLISECNCPITELIITTFAFNSRITNAIWKLISDGQVQKVSIFVNEGIKKRNSADNDQLTALVGNFPSIVRVIYAWNHSKISLIHIAGHYFIVDGSGNFGENAMFEQYSFWDEKEGYEFYKNSILHAINK